ncbi:MAG: isocitrate lyase, partial [Hyphomicrobium sp.]|nr:isocitrate lyase [Hyphomicrobium sp.]
AMTVFVEVAEAGSLSAAARRLDVPLTNVSRLLSQLEVHLNCTLVDRTTRRMNLTDAGRDYLATCRHVLEALEGAENRIAGHSSELSGEIAITAPVSFGRLHLLPVMTAFLAAYPRITARLQLMDRVVDLIEEIYVSLRQADEVAINDLFKTLKTARDAGDKAAEKAAIAAIDGFETHVVPIIADIDAGFGNENATYLLAKEMIKAGACCLQIENQVSDAKQCGHQDGKVTVPREDFIEKLRACRLAFEELGVDEGVIVARTDSLGAGLTQKVPVSQEPGDLASDYIKWLKTEAITPDNPILPGELALYRGGQFEKPVRMPNGLFAFQDGTGRARVIEDCIASLTQGGADLLWIETDTPNVDEIASMVSEIRKVVPNAKLTYNNSPSFNWTLNLRRQVREQWIAEGKIHADSYPDGIALMSA